MRIVVCEERAFMPNGALEAISENVPVDIANVNGKTLSGRVALFPFKSKKAESVFEFREGTGAISAAVFEAEERYKVFIEVKEKRLFAGEIRVVEDVSLGTCILPLRENTEHLWSIIAAMADYVQILREKIESHIDGADIV